LVPRPITLNVGTGSLRLSGSGTLTTHSPARDLSTVDRRLTALEEDVRRIEERITTTEASLRGETAKLRETVSAEQSSRVAADERLRQLVEDVAAGGLDFEAMGVVWLIAGEVFSSFSAEIARRLPNSPLA
jgi:hypothetical protein